MFDQIGMTYANISSVLGIIVGILIIIFRKKFLEAIKKRLSKKDDYLSRRMLSGWESRSDKTSHITIIIVGIVLIIIAILQLIQN